MNLIDVKFRCIKTLYEAPGNNYRICEAYFLQTLAEVYLTNRFHVAVRLFSNRSQMTSKCGKNKKVELTSFPGSSLYFEKIPWLQLVTCLLDFSRFQRCD